jgi:two-component system NtrC family sensor kinase
MQRLDRLASIGTLSASMAHEIKNALVAVNTFVQDLILRNKDAELAGLVSRELRRIDSIINQMLKFAGPAKPTFARISVHRILDQSLRLIQPQLERKQIRLRRSLAARHDKVEADHYQLEQAFLNLFLNAVAAMESQGELSVLTELVHQPPAPPATGPSESLLQVSIGDTGVGIPSDDLPRLFEPFFTTRSQGTGLGLAITRRILLEHRARITVESELKKGTVFRILFPLA